MEKGTTFGGSLALRKIIEGKGWTLYLLPKIPPSCTNVCEVLNTQQPVRRLQWGHVYLLAPRRLGEETLQEAFGRVNGSRPALEVNDTLTAQPADKVRFNVKSDVVVFTRLVFWKNFVTVDEPAVPGISPPTFVAIRCSSVVATFRECFRVVNAQERYVSWFMSHITKTLCVCTLPEQGLVAHM